MIPIEAQDIYLSQALDPKNSAPIFKAQRGKDWIPYLDTDNETQYPDVLIDLFNNSALHGAILRSKIDQVAGQGFVWDDSSLNAEMDFFMENINDEDINKADASYAEAAIDYLEASIGLKAPVDQPTFTTSFGLGLWKFTLDGSNLFLSFNDSSVGFTFTPDGSII